MTKRKPKLAAYAAGQTGPHGSVVCGARTRKVHQGKGCPCGWPAAKVPKGDPCPCTQPPKPGRTRCHYHGGNSPRGSASPKYKTGIYSRDLPTRLVARYEAGLADPELGDLRRQMALVVTRQGDLLSRLEEGDPAMLWRDIGAAWDRFSKANQRQDGAAMEDALADLGALIPRGRRDWAMWQELAKLSDQQRKLVESEARVISLHQVAIPVDQVLLLIGAVAEAVRRQVPDIRTRDAINSEIDAIVEGTSRELPG